MSREFVEAVRRYGASDRFLARLEEAMEEIVTVELNYAEVCALLESGTVRPGSAVHAKLMAARDAFRQEPKVYGRNLKRRGKA